MLFLKLILPVIIFSQGMTGEIYDYGIVEAVTKDSVMIGGFWFHCVPGFNDFTNMTFSDNVKDKNLFPFEAEIIWEPKVTVTGHEELLVKQLNMIRPVNKGSKPLD